MIRLVSKIIIQKLELRDAANGGIRNNDYAWWAYSALSRRRPGSGRTTVRATLSCSCGAGIDGGIVRGVLGRGVLCPPGECESSTVYAPSDSLGIDTRQLRTRHAERLSST